MALLNEGDEIIVPDPYFVLYPYLATFAQGRAVKCPIYPDFRLTAERVEPLITPRTKMVLLNSPGNPAGVVNTERECRDLLDLCRRRGIVLCSDEIYDEFTYSECRTQPRPGGSGGAACPSPARFEGAADTVLVVRGFGKSYGVTGWRLGYATGPRRLLEEMTKIQQYLYVSSPHPLQWGVIAAFDTDLSAHLAEYQRRRDMVVSRLSKVTEVPAPGGAFYAFVKVPESLGLPRESAGEEFFQRCVKRKVLIVPGRTFSERDTHFRLSFATPLENLERGLDVLTDVLSGK
jgi:aspartate/methionine/tyrosine aminotransferase